MSGPRLREPVVRDAVFRDGKYLVIENRDLIEISKFENFQMQLWRANQDYMLLFHVDDNKEILKKEKAFCDRALEVGLFSLNYKLIKTKIHNEDGTTTKSPALICKSFSAQSRESNITFLTQSPPSERRISCGPVKYFYNKDSKNIASQKWNKEIISKLLNDVALGVSYNLQRKLRPSFFFENPRSKNRPPIARIVYHDYRLSESISDHLPIAPYSQALKDNMQSVCDYLAMTIFFQTGKKEQDIFNVQGIRSYETLMHKLFNSITQDDLNKTLANVSKSVEKELHRKIKNVKRTKQSLSVYELRNLLKSAISIGSLENVKAILDLMENKQHFWNTWSSTIIQFCHEYKNEAVTAFLTKEKSKHIKPKTPDVDPIVPPKPDVNPKPDAYPEPALDTTPENQTLLKCAHNLRNPFPSRVFNRILIAGSAVGISLYFALAPVIIGIIGFSCFGVLTLIECIRSATARTNFNNRLHTKDIIIEDNQFALSKNSDIDPFYFKEGKNSEDDWASYIRSYTLPATFLSGTHAGDSFQLGREAKLQESGLDSPECTRKALKNK